MARNTTSDPAGLEADDDIGFGEHEGPESQGEYSGEPFGDTSGGAYGDEDGDPSYDDVPDPNGGDEARTLDDIAAGRTGEGPRPDESIVEDLAEQLADRLGIHPADVAIRVTAGAVTLAGPVDTDAIRDAAERIAVATPGVTAVENNLAVRDM